MTFCYYVTGHGFGHAIRSIQVIQALPKEMRVLIKSSAPERLFREEMPHCAFEFIPAEYDCGALQTDSVTTLPGATLTRYREIETRNEASLPDEIAFLRREDVRCVACDVPPFPLYAAQRAGIPGVAIANFTWHDIYAGYVQTPEDAALLGRIKAQYQAASLALITPLATPTVSDVFPNVAHIPLIARRGQNVRQSLLNAFGLPVGRNLALVYLGGWGMDILWDAVANLRDWVFLVDRPLPGAPPNVLPFDPAVWRYADVAASVDTVISKAGYGTVTDCIANSVPLIYLPREGFAEHMALVAGMQPWGGGIEITAEDFFQGHWHTALGKALTVTLSPDTYKTNGAVVAAEYLAQEGT